MGHVNQCGKNKVMLFGGSETDRVYLSMKGVQIEQVAEFKYLGVILDQQLRFNAHAEYAATKARKAFAKVGLIKLIDRRNGISVKLGLELFKRLFCHISLLSLLFLHGQSCSMLLLHSSSPFFLHLQTVDYFFNNASGFCQLPLISLTRT